MADKGFDLKLLVPTDDGLTISEKGVEGAMYYLSYNISNRSYQLAEKYKVANIFISSSFNWVTIKQLFDQHNIDKLLTVHSISEPDVNYLLVESNEISVLLNELIDKIDHKLLP